MSLGGEIYLAIIIGGFLTFVGTLFWGMLSTADLPGAQTSHRARPPAEDSRDHRSASR